MLDAPHLMRMGKTGALLCIWQADATKSADSVQKVDCQATVATLI
jgi:hypothetical protein